MTNETKPGAAQQPGQSPSGGVTEALEHCAQIAESIDSGRGNENEIAKAIRNFAKRQAALSRVRVDAWQPISSAPKDIKLLMFSPGYKISDDPDEPFQICVSTTRDWCWSTHWRPLPAPPMPEDLSGGHLNATGERNG